mmetsp:Transcript_16898/g.59006  ORF Transcript_16898/g.59006 Transcript_16898/m.59006 type:complete len:362 (+) Transcript_16898:4080-5165(+)
MRRVSSELKDNNFIIFALDALKSKVPSREPANFSHTFLGVLKRFNSCLRNSCSRCIEICNSMLSPSNNSKRCRNALPSFSSHASSRSSFLAAIGSGKNHLRASGVASSIPNFLAYVELAPSFCAPTVRRPSVTVPLRLNGLVPFLMVPEKAFLPLMSLDSSADKSNQFFTSEGVPAGSASAPPGGDRLPDRVLPVAKPRASRADSTEAAAPAPGSFSSSPPAGTSGRVVGGAEAPAASPTVASPTADTSAPPSAGTAPWSPSVANVSGLASPASSAEDHFRSTASPTFSEPLLALDAASLAAESSADSALASAPRFAFASRAAAKRFAAARIVSVSTTSWRASRSAAFRFKRSLFRYPFLP